MVEPARGVGRLLADGAAERLVVDQPGLERDLRVLAADRALGVLADLDRAVLHLQGVVDHQPADQRVADAGDQLDRLGDLDRADRRAQHAEHAALGARRHHAGRRGLGVEAAVAGRPPCVGPEDRRLAVEAVDRAPHVGLAEEDGGVVDQVAGREVVRAVDDEVVRLEDLEDVGRVEPLLVQDDLDERVDLLDRLLGRLGLRLPDVGLAVDDLALQVGLVDDVEVDDAEGADAGGGEVEQRGRAEPAGADDEHLGVLQPLLPGHADVGDDQVPGVAADLVDGQLAGGLHEGGEGHSAASG